MGLRQVLMSAYLIRKNKKERERWWEEFQGRCPWAVSETWCVADTDFKAMEQC